MSEPERLWSSVTDVFDTRSSRGAEDLRAADNILIAWPPILGALEDFAAGRAGRSLRVLDFGCGTGGLCQELQSRGFQVTGLDVSPAMIATAERHGPAGIRYRVGDLSSLSELGPFDVVTSIMVLQFIEDLSGCAAAIRGCLAPGGLFLFAVHNPEYIRLCLAHGFKFSGFDSVDSPGRGFIDFGQDRLIPLFNRESVEYDRAFLGERFEKILEERPPFNEEFIARHGSSQQRELLSEPKYLILGFRHTG